MPLKDYPYSVDLTVDESYDAKAWCQSNIGESYGPYHVHGNWFHTFHMRPDWPHIVRPEQVGPAVKFHFANEHHYMLFLLRWS